ncbi:MAG: ferredoxin reductase family protein [Oryzihumus sp.]
MAASPQTQPLPAPGRARRRQLHLRGRRHQQWRARVGDLLELLAAGLLVTTVSIFLRDGGGQHLVTGSWGSRLVAVGQLTGLVAVDLLLVQMLLAARVPWVDRVYGSDRALKAHRVLGRVTVPLVVVHAESLVLGYAARDGMPWWSGWLREPFAMLSGVPDMLTATIALALLVLIAVTSVRAAMRRVGYERWHLVHLGAYAAVTLAIPHQLSVGSDITRSGLVRAAWLGLYVLVAASIAWWRFALPVVRSVRHRLYVERVVQETPDTWSVTVKGRDLDALQARAGQFFQWRFLTRGLWAAAHPWSLSAQPDGRTLRLTVRELGDHSTRLAGLRPGTRVLVEGPYGAFTTHRRTRRRVLLLAAGIGVTPIRALAEELARDPVTAPGDVTVVYRADRASQLALRDELDEVSRHGGHRLHLLTGPPVRGSWLPEHVGRGDDDAKALAALVPHLREHDVYLCGPPVWMDLVHTSLRRARVPRAHIHDERFSW